MGSQVNIIPKKVNRRLAVKPRLHQTNIKLMSYSGDKITMCAEFSTQRSHSKGTPLSGI